METQNLPGFHVVGIALRTTNENNNQAARDIPALWQKFFAEGIHAKIPAKLDEVVYCVYTDYEQDYTKPYTVVLGSRVENLDNIPEGMTGITIGDARYAKFEAKGNIMQGAITEAWFKIWDTKLDRAYSADFEVYDEKSADPKNAVVDIFIGVK